jgi:ABC-type transporter Mla subunit MlaD
VAAPLRNGRSDHPHLGADRALPAPEHGAEAALEEQHHRLNTLVESLATITKGKQTQVAEIIKGLGALTTTVDQRSGQVSQLIDSANTLSSTLAAKDQELVSIVNNLNTVSTGLADHSTDLSNLITNVDQMATQTNSLVSGTPRNSTRSWPACTPTSPWWGSIRRTWPRA